MNEERDVDRDAWARAGGGNPADHGGCLDFNVLAGYLDGRLPARDLEAVETHLAACPDCREAVRDARAAAEEPASAPLTPDRSWRQAAGWAAAVAGMAAVALLGFKLGENAVPGRDQAEAAALASLSPLGGGEQGGLR